MRPKFAIAVDRVFAQVLDLLQRIDKGETVSPETERTRIQALINQSENELGRGDEWDLAKYALVSWIDEMLVVGTTWEGSVWWNDFGRLEFEHFRTNERAEKFFVNAKKAASSAMKRRDALEVYYIAVVLGFGGIYLHGKPGEAEVWARRNDLPPSIEQWLRQTSKSIVLGADRPPLDMTPANPGYDAAPREGEAIFVTSLLIGVALAALSLAIGVAHLSSLVR